MYTNLKQRRFGARNAEPGPVPAPKGGLANRGKRRIYLLASLIECLLAGLHPGEDAFGGIVEGLLDLRVGLTAPGPGNAVTRPLVEQPGDLAQCAGTLEERIVLHIFERGQGKSGL